MKILIVDDNLSMRKVLSALFESRGHQVVAALEDGSRLIRHVKESLHVNSMEIKRRIDAGG